MWPRATGDDMPCPLTHTHKHIDTHIYAYINTQADTHTQTHTHTLPHRHINIHNYNLISGHELQRRSLQTDQLTDRMVPLLFPSPPLWPAPPPYATVALPLLLSLFRLLAACECRCGCRFLSPINFLLIRSLFLHTHSHSCCTRAADNARTHTHTHARIYMLL